MAKVSESLEKSGNKGDAEDEETYEGGTVMAPWSEKDHQSPKVLELWPEVYDRHQPFLHDEGEGTFDRIPLDRNSGAGAPLENSPSTQSIGKKVAAEHNLGGKTLGQCGCLLLQKSLGLFHFAARPRVRGLGKLLYPPQGMFLLP